MELEIWQLSMISVEMVGEVGIWNLFEFLTLLIITFLDYEARSWGMLVQVLFIVSTVEAEGSTLFLSPSSGTYSWLICHSLDGKVSLNPEHVMLDRRSIWGHSLIMVGEGNGNPLQYSCCENPMDRRAWQATVHGVAKNQTLLSMHMARWGVAAFIMVVLCCSVSMVSVCLPSDALLQHLPSYLAFSYLGHGVSLHGCSSKVQPLLLTLDEG